MLFTTAPFILVFLPITLAGFFLLGRFRKLAAAWLFAASLCFYGYWMPAFTLLLVASIAVNFTIGTRIARRALQPAGRAWLVAGITANLIALGYFKYANFFIANLDAVLGTDWHAGRIVLPIGISFYTFTQIAFLVDTYQNKARDYEPIHYGLFVTYFPHLIAGPVLHHRQMMPQFAEASIYRFNTRHFVAGLAIFAIGLAKKVVLADGISPYADAVFRPADAGDWPDLAEAWLGALAYTFQIYFDFSGYSDMAIGLSWMFNIRLPFNFDSPYRATSITDFWRRWHMTLSAFLRDYLYIALGGNRRGPARRYANLMLTMLLGGLWHGASWSFVLWGGLHGLYLTINHAFRSLCGAERMARLDRSRAFKLLAWALTMLAVVVAWVFFRAETHDGAMRILAGMIGARATGAEHPMLWNAGLQLQTGLSWCVFLGAIACLAPNSNRIGTWLLERPTAIVPMRGFLAGSAASAVLLLLVINVARDSVSAFIYFNF
jgi:alginate O-acetyltransferase complex protein AlgI